MSLQKLLKVAGYYDEMPLYFQANNNKYKYIDKSSKELKNLIEQYQKSETDLLQFDSKKRGKTREASFIIFETIKHLKLLKEGKSEYALKQAAEQLNKSQDLLNPSWINMTMANCLK